MTSIGTSTVAFQSTASFNTTQPWCIDITSPSLSQVTVPTFSTPTSMDNSSMMWQNASEGVLPFCDDMEPEAGGRDSIRKYLEYVVATYINKYYLYVILAIGLPGNMAALATVLSMKPFVSSSLYMAALSIADSINLILKILYLQLTLYDIQLFDIGCKLCFFFGTFFMHLSNWILVAMTIERFVAIWFPLKVTEICTKSKAMLAIGIVSGFLFLLNLHFLFTMHEVTDPRFIYDCRWMDEYVYFKDKVWYWIDGAAYSLLPFVALTVFNVLIVIGINRSARTQKVLTNKQTKEKMSQQHQITVSIANALFPFIYVL